MANPAGMAKHRGVSGGPGPASVDDPIARIDRNRGLGDMRGVAVHLALMAGWAFVLAALARRNSSFTISFRIRARSHCRPDARLRGN